MSDFKELLESTEGLTEDFKAQAQPLFEAAVNAKADALTADLTESFKASLEEKQARIAELEEAVKLAEEKCEGECEKHKKELEEIEDKVEELADEKCKEEMQEMASQLDKYFDYLAEEYVREFHDEVVSAQKVAIAESFMGSMKSLFESYHVQTPEAVNVYEQKIADLEERNDTIAESLRLQVEKVRDLESQILDAEKIEICEAAIADFADTDKIRFKRLASTITTDDLEQFRSQVSTIVESMNVGEEQTIAESIVTESVPLVSEEAKAETKAEVVAESAVDPMVAALAKVLKGYN